MAIGLGTDGKVTLGAKGGAQTNITSLIKKISWKIDNNEVDITTFGNYWQKIMAGISKGTMSIDGINDFATLFPILTAIGVTATGTDRWKVDISIWPQGDTAGTTDPKMTATCLLRSAGSDQTVEDYIPFAWELTVDGAMTWGLNG